MEIYPDQGNSLGPIIKKMGVAVGPKTQIFAKASG